MKTEIVSLLGFLLVFLFSVLTWSFAHRAIASSTERLIWKTLSAVGGFLLLLGCCGELIMFSEQMQSYLFSYTSRFSSFAVARAVLAYLFASVVAIMLLQHIKLVWVKATLVTLYFCVTLFTFLFLNTVFFSFWVGRASEDLRRSSVDTAENVRTLLLLQKSNAREADSNHYWWVTHSLENEIDNLLPVANDYLINRSSLCWRLQEWLFLGDMREVCFERDLPLVVRYRKVHPPVWNHGPYDLIMKQYKEPKQLWKEQMWPFENNSRRTIGSASDREGQPNKVPDTARKLAEPQR